MHCRKILFLTCRVHYLCIKVPITGGGTQYSSTQHLFLIILINHSFRSVFTSICVIKIATIRVIVLTLMVARISTRIRKLSSHWYFFFNGRCTNTPVTLGRPQWPVQCAMIAGRMMLLSVAGHRSIGAMMWNGMGRMALRSASSWRDICARMSRVGMPLIWLLQSRISWMLWVSFGLRDKLTPSFDLVRTQ